MSAERILIINADDFGLTEGVNRAIVDCHLAGSVTSTTLMVNMPAAAHAMELAAANPSLGVGWHANLTLGRCVSMPQKISSLVGPDGTFHPRGTMEQRLILGRIRREEVALELEAQYRRFCGFGRQPTHIDSHQHVHVFPLVFDSLAALAEREKLPVRMPWRWPGTQRTGLRKWVRATSMQALLWRNARRWRGRVSTNSGLCSLFDLTYRPDEIDAPLYRRLLQAYKCGVVELMVHPADVDANLRVLTSITDFSAEEARFLATPALPLLARELGFRLETYAYISA